MPMTRSTQGAGCLSIGIQQRFPNGRNRAWTLGFGGPTSRVLGVRETSITCRRSLAMGMRRTIASRKRGSFRHRRACTRRGIRAGARGDVPGPDRARMPISLALSAIVPEICGVRCSAQVPTLAAPGRRRPGGVAKPRGLTQVQLAGRRVCIATRSAAGARRRRRGLETLAVLRSLGVIEGVTRALDPYESDIGRLRADEHLPQRVRPKRLTGAD